MYLQGQERVCECDKLGGGEEEEEEWSSREVWHRGHLTVLVLLGEDIQPCLAHWRGLLVLLVYVLEGWGDWEKVRRRRRNSSLEVGICLVIGCFWLVLYCCWE